MADTLVCPHCKQNHAAEDCPKAFEYKLYEVRPLPPPPPAEGPAFPAVKLPTSDQLMQGLEQLQGNPGAAEIKRLCQTAASLYKREPAAQDEFITTLVARSGVGKRVIQCELKVAIAELTKQKVEQGDCDPLKWLPWCQAQFRIIRNYGSKLAVVPKLKSSDDSVRPPMGKRAFEDSNLGRKVHIGFKDDGTPVYKPVHEWYLQHPEADCYETQIFKPVHGDKSDEYNVWQGWPWSRPEQVYTCHSWPCVGDKAEDGSIHWPRIQHFLRHVVCSSNDEHFKYLVKWLAHWVQFPLEYNTTVIGIRGEPGVGKTKLLQLVRALIGADYSHIFTNPESLKRNFNAMMLYRLFLGFDEAFTVGDKVADAIFKNLVTGDVFTVEKKFLDAFEARKFFRMIFASNEQWFMNADFGDRRQFLLTCSNTRQKDSKYFMALDDAMGPDGEMWAFFEFLQKMPLSDFDLRAIPQTDTLMAQKINSLRGNNRVLHSLLEAGLLPLGRHGPSMQVDARSFDADLEESWVEAHYVPTQAFMEVLVQSGYDFRMDTRSAGKILAIIGGGGSFAGPYKGHVRHEGGFLSNDQRMHEGKNLTGRWVGPLWLSRHLAEKHYKVRGLDWGASANEWSNWD